MLNKLERLWSILWLPYGYWLCCHYSDFINAFTLFVLLSIFETLWVFFFNYCNYGFFYFHYHQPDVGSTKSNSAKSRPSTLSTNNEANSAKRPSPTTANKKSPAPKATTPTAAKRPPTAAAPNKAAKVSSQHDWIPFVQAWWLERLDRGPIRWTFFWGRVCVKC